MKLTEHFSLDEFVPAAIDSTPEVRANLHMLAALLLEPARAELGKAVTVSSGWRPSAHNAAVGGVRGSDHETGRAADLQVWEDGVLNVVETNALFHILRENGHYGQLIFEDHRHSTGKPTSVWVHVSLPTAKHPGFGEPNRLLVSYEPKKYVAWDDTKA